MNREKILFLVVIAIAALWGVSSLMSLHKPESAPSGRKLTVEVPEVKDIGDLPEHQRLLQLAADWSNLMSAVPDSGRTALVPHSDLLPVEPAELDLPRALSTPVVLPPLSRFPSVRYYRRFRAEGIEGVTGGPEEAAVEEWTDETEEDEPVDEGEVLEARKKWTFEPDEWDRITLNAGPVWYGRISLKKEQSAAGHSKYDLLLSESRELPFDFEQINTRTGRVETEGSFTLESSGVAKVEFAEHVENLHWAKRTVDRVRTNDPTALLAHARWLMEQSEDPAYDRLTGLGLVVDTLEEALVEDPGDLEITLELGEALHRSFRFDEELALYEKAIADKPAAALFARLGRSYRKFSLTDMEEVALSKALEMAPGDTRARLERGEALFALGRYEAAAEDFDQVARGGTPEEQEGARGGRARVYLVAGEPERAESFLAGAEDAMGVTILGAAQYAQMKWEEARASFERAVTLDPGSYIARTALGYAEALAAKDWQGIEKSLATLGEARTLHPLNYFWPPLGMGFAEQRRGGDRYTLSVEHYLTAAQALPLNPYVHYMLGVSYFRDGQYAEARKEYMKALELDYRFVDALIGAGTAAMAMEDWAAARADLTRALELERRGLDEVAGDMKEEARAQKGVILTLYRLGRVYLVSDDLADADRLAKARDLFLDIEKLDDTHAPTQNALGYISYLLGQVDPALNRFDKARDLSQPKTADRKYAEDGKARILDSENRRLWRDSFERPNSEKAGNDWAQSNVGAIQPRIRSNRAQVGGGETRMASRGLIWLTRGDKALNGKFIRTAALVRVGERDRVAVRYIVYTLTGGNVGNACGIERSPIGEIVAIHRKPNDEDWTREVLKDADGNSVKWGAESRWMRIVRSDPDKGVFDLYVDNTKLGSVELGVKKRPGKLDFGFQFEASTGEQFTVDVEEVEMEMYVN